MIEKDRIKNEMKLPLFVVGIFIMMLVINGISLGIVVRYGYMPVRAHYQAENCNITYCLVTPRQCCYYNKYNRQVCSNCDTIGVQIQLNDTIVNYPDGRYSWREYDVCGFPTIRCYYDDRDLNGTLSLDQLPAPVASVGIILIVIFMVILFLAFIGSMIILLK